MTHFKMRPIAFAMLGLLCFSVGCGQRHDYGPTGRITGRLTMNGQPLEPGTTVSFMQPEAGYLAFGATDENGNFEVTSWNGGAMPIGTYRVMIQPPGGELDPESPEAAELALEGGRGRQKAPFPEKYRAFPTSGLSYEIVEGNNHFEIDLK
jgi:hypothetical protein